MEVVVTTPKRSASISWCIPEADDDGEEDDEVRFGMNIHNLASSDNHTAMIGDMIQTWIVDSARESLKKKHKKRRRLRDYSFVPPRTNAVVDTSTPRISTIETTTTTTAVFRDTLDDNVDCTAPVRKWTKLIARESANDRPIVTIPEISMREAVEYVNEYINRPFMDFVVTTHESYTDTVPINKWTTHQIPGIERFSRLYLLTLSNEEFWTAIKSTTMGSSTLAYLATTKKKTLCRNAMFRHYYEDDMANMPNEYYHLIFPAKFFKLDRPEDIRKEVYCSISGTNVPCNANMRAGIAGEKWYLDQCAENVIKSGKLFFPNMLVFGSTPDMLILDDSIDYTGMDTIDMLEYVTTVVEVKTRMCKNMKWMKEKNGPTSRRELINTLLMSNSVTTSGKDSSVSNSVNDDKHPLQDDDDDSNDRVDIGACMGESPIRDNNVHRMTNEQLLAFQTSFDGITNKSFFHSNDSSTIAGDEDLIRKDAGNFANAFNIEIEHALAFHANFSKGTCSIYRDAIRIRQYTTGDLSLFPKMLNDRTLQYLMHAVSIYNVKKDLFSIDEDVTIRLTWLLVNCMSDDYDEFVNDGRGQNDTFSSYVEIEFDVCKDLLNVLTYHLYNKIVKDTKILRHVSGQTGGI